jgi:hypothetical protein
MDPLRNKPSHRCAVVCGVLFWGATGCPSDPGGCEEIGAGELVITELRGEQAGDDSMGQWLELYNASSTLIDLSGLAVVTRSLARDVGSTTRYTVRTADLFIPPGAYVVLGFHEDTWTTPPFVAVSIAPGTGSNGAQATPGLQPSGDVTLEACGELVDRVSYRTGLPAMGTYAFDGALPPDAERNDDETLWCNDDGSQTSGHQETSAQGIGVPGTPAAVNVPCNSE